MKKRKFIKFAIFTLQNSSEHNSFKSSIVSHWISRWTNVALKRTMANKKFIFDKISTKSIIFFAFSSLLLWLFLFVIFPRNRNSLIANRQFIVRILIFKLKQQNNSDKKRHIKLILSNFISIFTMLLHLLTSYFYRYRLSFSNSKTTIDSFI